MIPLQRVSWDGRRKPMLEEHQPDGYCYGSPLVRAKDLPHQRLKLEERVGNVKDSQEPGIAVSIQAQIFLHPRDFGISGQTVS